MEEYQRVIGGRTTAGAQVPRACVLAALINNDDDDDDNDEGTAIYSKGFVLPSWARFSRRYN